MVDYQSPQAEKSSSSAMKRKKKRKLPDLEKKHEEKASKSSRITQSDDFPNETIEEDKETTSELLEDSTPWRNLLLVLSLQKKNIDIEKKVELAYTYVKLSFSQEADDTTQTSEAVSFERVIVFLNNWVQSTLISSEKKIRVGGHDHQFGVSGSCLDYRCWEIFKFCLEEGMKLHVSLSFARDILKVIHCMASNMEIKDMSDDELTLYNTMLDCVSFIFTSHGGVSNESLDLWILLVGTLLELVLKVITSKLDGSRLGTIILNLTCLVLEPFTKFMRMHPNRKTGFHDFVDRLLEPLLCLLHVLPPSVLAVSPAWMSKLLKLIEEVLSQGLFHSSHIDGFLTLQSLAKYKPSDEGKPKDLKTVIKSYHRHLFDRLGRIVVEKKGLSLFGEGELFRLYVHCIKRQQGVEVTEGCGKSTDHLSGEMLKRSSGSNTEIHHVSALSAEIRKSLFDFFVQIMEPLLGDIDAYLQDELEVGSLLEDILCTLKSTNSILISLMQEKVYLRVDDTSEGACASFLKLICDKITLLSSKIGQLVPSILYVNSGTSEDSVKFVAKELLLCIHYLLEIDYEVFGNDLESLWLLMFSYGTLGHTLTDLQDKSSVVPEILHLGCHMINLYSELRQVGTSVFALCKVIRRLVSSVSDIEAYHSESRKSSLYHESWTKSLRLMLFSPELRLSIHNAVKSIPEGQVSLFIRELATDLSESLEWMKGDCPLPSDGDLELFCQDGYSSSCFHLKAEVLGSGLSEVYALILDSLIVTTGNSSLVGVSLNALMAVIRPSMSILVSQPTDGVYEFLSVVSGRKFSNQAGCKDETLSAHWFFLFFFRLYMSCRSSYHQAISLAPPATSERMSEVMQDSLAACSGNDWLEKTEKDKGYFSWIVEPSVSLFLIIEAISDIFLKESMPDISPLTYVLNAMSLQRLVDLNRLINSFEFVLKRNDMKIAKANEEDDTFSKKNKRLRKCLSKLKEEATGLTKFMMGHLVLLNKCRPNFPSEEDGWDFAVAAINKKSLPSAFWCIICQNIDIWSTHAAKKKSKMFLSLLLQKSLPYSNFKQFGEHDVSKPENLKTITGRYISLELLSSTMFYEEKFVRKYMASSFCQFLEELVSPLFSDVHIELQAEPNWTEVLSSFKITSVVPNNSNAANHGSSKETSFSHSTRKSCSEQEVDPSIGMIYTVCQSSLNFLCWMPKRFISSKSFSLYATCILNLERLLVGTLLCDNDSPSLNGHYEILQLLICCRKALKNLMVTFCEENMEVGHNSLGAIHFGGKFPALWLLESLLSVQHAFSKDGDTRVRDLMFSLMDYTSYVFLTLIKGSLIHASDFLISSRKAFQQRVVSAYDQEDSGHSGCTSCLDQSESIDACNFMIQVAEALKDHSQVMITTQRETPYCGRAKSFADVYNLQKLSSIISCFQGCLWGLSSALCHMDAQNNNLKAIFSRRNFEPVDKLKLCMESYTTFIKTFLCELVLQDDKRLKDSSDCQASPVRLCNEDHREPNFSGVLERIFNLENVDMGSMYINNSFLCGLLAEENLVAAFFLRQLFIAYSALLRLNSLIKASLSSNLVNIFVGISEILLLEFSNKAGTPSQFTFVFLDGIGKFLEELANHLLLTNPSLPTEVYARLIDLHLKAIGKCISLQGKVATLESHETESSTKTMNGPIVFSEGAYFSGLSSLHELKSRLRMSFKVFVRKSSESHISSAVWSIKKALVGLQEGCMANYRIYTGSSGGGKVSSIVAAGVDCFDLVLEAITGRKSLSTVKTDILGSVCCLFNIILHLQGPGIFYKNPVLNIHDCADPDPGSVVLMCIEVLTKVSGKHALYQMDACYVAQALSIPATLFQNILQLRKSEAPTQSAFLRLSNIEDMNESMNVKLLDQQYSIELYAACCRMLYTFLRHHKRESLQHIALLQASVSVLLHCLEMVHNEQAVRKSYVVWGVQEGAKCGAFLRRIYEEIRQQKDALGQYCRLFLSSYITVFSGYGPLKVGIRREVDEALRPGVYALIDACSPDDLQYIHTVLGEGPCRNSLANLQHDYKLNFQYEGKV